MSTTYTTNLRLTKPAVAGDSSVWGGYLNAGVIDMIDDAISGMVSIAVSGLDITLTTANGSTDQSRYAILNLTGSPGGTRNIIVPNLTKTYIVVNATNASQVVKTAAGSGVTIPSGRRQLVMCDGTNVTAVVGDTSTTVDFANTAGTATNATQLGGVAASGYPLKSAANVFTGSIGTAEQTATGSAFTPDGSLSNVFRYVLTGNATISNMTSPANGGLYTFNVRRSGGAWTLMWGSMFRFTDSIQLPGTQTDGAFDTFQFVYDNYNGILLLTSHKPNLG